MVLSRRQVVGVFITILISPIIFWLLLWASILLISNTYAHNLSKAGLWPIICSTKGCVTTSGWHKQYQSQLFFSEASEKDNPRPEDALTTLARQHLVNKALSSWPVSIREARRYREEVLQARDETKILETTGMTISEYDKSVILPLLKQEVLKEQMEISNLEELYKQLADQRKMWVLPRGLIWDKETATVVKR